MTTDPRVIECAKAMLVWDKSDPEGECLGDLISEPEQIATLARACILKWLAQELSDGMGEAGEALDGGIYDRSGPRAHYRAMCAQAAKEIAQ